MEQQLKLAEKKADIAVVWALGDGDGPLGSEVKIGCGSRSAFAAQVKAMRAARSRTLAHRAEVYVRGEGAGQRLKNAVAQRLHELGCGLAKSDWFSAAYIVEGIVTECATIEGVTLLSEADAQAIEQQELEKVQAQMR